MRQTVDKVNTIFIALILVVVYILGVGIANIIYKFLKFGETESRSSYWLKEKFLYNKKYFESPY